MKTMIVPTGRLLYLDFGAENMTIILGCYLLVILGGLILHLMGKKEISNNIKKVGKMNDWYEKIMKDETVWNEFSNAIAKSPQPESKAEREKERCLWRIIAGMYGTLYSVADGLKEEADTLKSEVDYLKDKQSLLGRWLIAVSIVFFLMLTALIWKVFAS